MIQNQFALLKDRRFLPLFVTQFLGAFHDNLFKNALVVLLLYDLGTGTALQGYDPKLLVTLAAGIFILPFVLFSALGGQLADKFPKDRIVRILKMAEIPVALLGAMALWQGMVWAAFAVLFLLGTQSAFFGPSKYSFLPQHLQDDELIGGNALLNTGTFLAILFGTIAGALLVLQTQGTMIVGGLIIACALCGYGASRFIPHSPPRAPDIAIDFNLYNEIRDIAGFIRAQGRVTGSAIFGVGWFYFLGGMFMAQFPNFTKETLGASEHVLAAFLVLFSIGVSIGGLLNNRLLGGRITTVYVPWALCGIAVLSCDLYFTSRQMAPAIDPRIYKALSDFMVQPQGLRIMLDLFLIALCGGLFVVPLNALIQHEAVPEHRARILAGSAIVNAACVIASSVVAALMIAAGMTVAMIILLFSLMGLPVAFLLYRIHGSVHYKVYESKTYDG